MGGTMTSHHPTQAEDTLARLQEAARSGRPVMIPGGFEIRDSRSIVRAPDSGASPVLPRASGGNDRELLERAREGGGALRERTDKAHRTIFERLWRYLLHPTDTPAV
jgi:hypothetical protein